jgi:arsenate reductase (glutaredoxin)
MATIYHNPRCRKSRAGLQYLETKTNQVEVIKYLNEGLSTGQLAEIIAMTGRKAEDFVRKQEDIYKQQYKAKELTDEEWIEALAKHPKMLQRPIVVKDGKAVLGNPPEEIDTLF